MDHKYNAPWSPALINLGNIAREAREAKNKPAYDQAIRDIDNYMLRVSVQYPDQFQEGAFKNAGQSN